MLNSLTIHVVHGLTLKLFDKTSIALCVREVSCLKHTIVGLMFAHLLTNLIHNKPSMHLTFDVFMGRMLT